MTTIFVFGSNLAGRHGKGAALYAKRHYGAEYGVGLGRTGDSYAIPTKGYSLEVLPLYVINKHIIDFIDYVNEYMYLQFYITNIGCGLAGYKPKEIAPFFKELNNHYNCTFSPEFREIIDND